MGSNVCLDRSFGGPRAVAIIYVLYLRFGWERTLRAAKMLAHPEPRSLGSDKSSDGQLSTDAWLPEAATR